MGAAILSRVFRTACQACHCECGVLVYVDGGRIKKIRGDLGHPMNRGFICVKGEKYAEFVDHPDRIRSPLRRVGSKGAGRWEPISWDQALTEISDKLNEIKEKYGPEAFATLYGTGPRSSLFPANLLPYALGSPNAANTNMHMCYAPSILAETCTFGTSVMMEVGPDYRNSRCILVWGANPLASHPARGAEILRTVEGEDAKLIVIDPRRTLLASKADEWLQVRPGTDAALALAMINTIINEELYDRNFVDKWCHGFNQLRDHVQKYSPEEVAQITWIPAEKIREAATLYATSKPAVLHHRVAIEQTTNSIHANRALCLMIALTGNLDVKGGNLFPSYPRGYVPGGQILGGRRDFRPTIEVERKRLGSETYPLMSGPDSPVPFVHPAFLIEAITEENPYTTKAVFCTGANPVLTIQDSVRVWNALKKLELFVVVDFFMTPTAEIADYVLPATMWPERDECCDQMYTNYIGVRQKAVDPPPECWDDLKIAIELVKRIPWADRRLIPWNSTEEFNDWQVGELGLDFSEFRDIAVVTQPLVYRKFEQTGISTPTGKVELYSTILARHGYDPLPLFVEPPESPYGSVELAKEYPYILITGGRHIEYFSSEGRQIPSLRSLVPDPLLEINPETAKMLGASEGDWVYVETPQIKGKRVRLRAKLTQIIDPRVVHAAHGWWFPEKDGPEHGCFESNPNVVLSLDPPRAPVCGSARTRGTLCRIYTS